MRRAARCGKRGTFEYGILQHGLDAGPGQKRPESVDAIERGKPHEIDLNGAPQDCGQDLERFGRCRPAHGGNGLDGGRTHVRIVICQKRSQRVERGREQRARQGFRSELLAIRVERAQLAGKRLHGRLGERAQGFDRRVAQAYVVPGLERAEQAIQQLWRRSQPARNFDGLLSHAPITIAQRAQQITASHFSVQRQLFCMRFAQRIPKELDRTTTRLRIIGGKARFELSRAAHLTALIDARKICSGIWRVSTSNWPTSSTNVNVLSWVVTPAMPRNSSPAPRAGGGLISAPPLPNTSVTRSTAKPTPRPSTSIKIHLPFRGSECGASPKRTRKSMIGRISPR